MRLVPLASPTLRLLVLCLAAPLAAQTPDPTPPERYYPLHVGNVWEYGPETGGAPGPYGFRRTVTHDTVAAGRTYAVVREQLLRRIAGDWYSTEDRLVLRFDTASATVRTLRPEGERDLFGCRLDLPPYIGACEGAGPYTYYRVSLFAGASVGSEYVSGALRVIEGEAPTPRLDLLAGVGEVVRYGRWSSFPEFVAEYARVDGVEYGDRIAGLPADAPPLPSSGDPTPPEDYYPLAVGNRWEAVITGAGPPGWKPTHLRVSIPGDTLIDGERWFDRRQQYWTHVGGAWSPAYELNDVVRFDTASATLVRQVPSGAEEPVYPCRFDGPLTDTVPAKCPTFEFGWYTKRSGEQRFGVEIVALTINRGFGVTELAAGIGFVFESYELDTEATVRFARVGGATYGTPLGIPEVVAGDAPPSAPALALRVAPNPSDGPVTLAVVGAASPVAVEAFDALGRRVWRGSVAGETTVDVRGWAPGVYVLRATAPGGATTVSRFVRR